MAQVLTDNTQSASGSRSMAKIINVLLWVLQIGAAGMFLMVGFLKLSGDPQLVGLFKAIGIGQWFRYLTGTLEVVGAILLLIPRTSGLGALMLAVVMVGAVITHLFIIGDIGSSRSGRLKSLMSTSSNSALPRFCAIS